MKTKLIIPTIFALIISSCGSLQNLEAPAETKKTYHTRANGTASGKIVLGKTSGTLQLGSSKLDNISGIVYNPANSNGPSKLTFNRTGSYNQNYVGWVSSDKKQIAGYFVSGTQKFPFSCTEVDDVNYSSEKQKDLSGTWIIRCNGTARGAMTISNDKGSFQVGSSRNDKISIVKQERTGSAGALEIKFERTGSYNQTYFAWVSSDKKQMSGYYTHAGKEYPFYAFKK